MRRVLRTLAVGFVIVLLVATLFGAYQLVTWPRVGDLATENPSTTAFIEAYLARQDTDPRARAVSLQWVPHDEISPHVKRAVVAAEDLEFFSHNGISTHEIKAAVRKAVEEGKELRGASTITQQLAKNLWLSPSRNPWRKVKELILTRQLEKHCNKQRILELYLNVVEFGEGIYGVAAASAHYFGTTARTLTEEQAAMLAASLPRPSSWHPGSTSDAYAAYVETILERMDRATFLWRHVGETAAEPLFESLPGGDTQVPVLRDSLESLPSDTSHFERIYRQPVHEVRNDTSWVG